MNSRSPFSKSTPLLRPTLPDAKNFLNISCPEVVACILLRGFSLSTINQYLAFRIAHAAKKSARPLTPAENRSSLLRLKKTGFPRKNQGSPVLRVFPHQHSAATAFQMLSIV